MIAKIQMAAILTTLVAANAMAQSDRYQHRSHVRSDEERYQYAERWFPNPAYALSARDNDAWLLYAGYDYGYSVDAYINGLRSLVAPTGCFNMFKPIYDSAQHGADMGAGLKAAGADDASTNQAVSEFLDDYYDSLIRVSDSVRAEYDVWLEFDRASRCKCGEYWGENGDEYQHRFERHPYFKPEHATMELARLEFDNVIDAFSFESGDPYGAPVLLFKGIYLAAEDAIQVIESSPLKTAQGKEIQQLVDLKKWLTPFIDKPDTIDPMKFREAIGKGTSAKAGLPCW